ncbi:MAG: hypothetical protein AAB676_04145 [Verrucomicrobiota bacterium]
MLVKGADEFVLASIKQTLQQPISAGAKQFSMRAKYTNEESVMMEHNERPSAVKSWRLCIRARHCVFQSSGVGTAPSSTSPPLGSRNAVNKNKFNRIRFLQQEMNQDK